MKDFFKELFAYNLSSNENYLRLLLENEKRLNEKSVSLINHILNAHHIWNHRIEKQKPQHSVWEINKLNTLGHLNQENHKLSLEILDRCSLEQKMDYVNTQGHAFSNTVKDVFFHVINHSNYHRAQIASALKILGIEPPKSDFIVYKR